MARPPKPTPDARILELGAKGLGEAAIAAQLAKDGHTIAARTVGRRLAALRAGGRKAPGKKVPPPATAKDADQDESGTDLDLETLDIERLPAELLVRASRKASEALERELAPGGNILSADKIATVLERFAARLVEVRPPERVDPVKDPANVEARREILARWDLLRDPYEVSAPVVDQLQAHVDALRARSREAAGAP